MPKPNLIVSTCGTSLLTNRADGSLRKLLLGYANTTQPTDVPDEARQRIQQHLQARQQECAYCVRHKNLKQLMELSAELNGIIRFYDGNLRATTDHHTLLATDTWLGESTAQIVREVLESFGHHAEVRRVRDLRTNDLQSFRWAMSDLVAWCADTLAGYRVSGYRVIFNLTGGFKSVQGFMQALGIMHYADESIYVFEQTEQLLRLPRLPVTLDAVAILRPYLQTFRRLAIGLKVNEAAVVGISDTLLNNLDGEITLSPWGELIWREGYRSIYSDRLLEPITTKLRFGTHFQDSLKDLPVDRWFQLNERLDQLARYLEEGESYNPRSLDFKKLKGSYQNSTHECDGFADLGAPRLFGHFENNGYVLDRFGPGLH